MNKIPNEILIINEYLYINDAVYYNDKKCEGFKVYVAVYNY